MFRPCAYARRYTCGNILDAEELLIFQGFYHGKLRPPVARQLRDFETRVSPSTPRLD